MAPKRRLSSSTPVKTPKTPRECARPSTSGAPPRTPAENPRDLNGKNLHFKALYLLDNAPGPSSRSLSFDHRAFNVTFLPPNTTNHPDQGDQDDDDDEDEEQVQRSLTLRGLREIFLHTDQLGEEVMDKDPVVDRASKFKRCLEALLLPYREAYRHLEMTTKQSTITTFSKPTHETPSTSSLSAPTSPDHSSLAMSPIVDIDVSRPESPPNEEEGEEDVDDPLLLC